MFLFVFLSWSHYIYWHSALHTVVWSILNFEDPRAWKMENLVKYWHDLNVLRSVHHVPGFYPALLCRWYADFKFWQVAFNNLHLSTFINPESFSLLADNFDDVNHSKHFFFFVQYYKLPWMLYFIYNREVRKWKSACYKWSRRYFYENCILSGTDCIFKTKVSQAPIILKCY